MLGSRRRVMLGSRRRVVAVLSVVALAMAACGSTVEEPAAEVEIPSTTVVEIESVDDAAEVDPPTDSAEDVDAGNEMGDDTVDDAVIERPVDPLVDPTEIEDTVIADCMNDALAFAPDEDDDTIAFDEAQLSDCLDLSR